MRDSFERWYVRVKPTVDEGIAVCILKTTLFCPAFIWQIVFFRPLTIATNRVATRLISDSRCRKILTLDAYKLITSICLIIAYVIAWYSSRSCHFFSVFVTGTIALIAMLRASDLLLILVALNCDQNYRPKTFSRALMNSFWHYLDVGIVYGIVYLALGQEAFKDANFGENLFSSAYFSFVTLSTLGYGDISPTTGVTQALVVSQVLWGLFLIIIVLPSAFAKTVEQFSCRSRTLLFSSNAEWLSKVYVRDEILKLNHEEDVSIGGVLIARQNERYWLVQKSPRKDYECSNQWVFPGGLARTTQRSVLRNDIERILRESICERFELETRIRVNQQEVYLLDIVPPPIAKYSVKGETKYCIVIPFLYDGEFETSQLQGREDSVRACQHEQLEPMFDSLAPVSRYFAAIVRSVTCQPLNQVLLTNVIKPLDENAEKLNLPVATWPYRFPAE